ncbi:hypothetical protein RHSIM_Rhsim04G0040900 [Rhododendron simsii]|uniref:Uncharacterized protein n=1 Tax=Rhododendron simsii TaxID=118357 RepID=A0A834H3R6_RHOSS|nr:hypothetical protein RHSIM_Rhsim04G0040900 [Rhododendron simsii]
MVVCAPFVRWDIIRHACGDSARAGVYYLETAQGEKVVCVNAILDEGNHMTYKPFDSFLNEYRALLPSIRVLEWNFRFQLAAWLDGIVYYLFLQHSGEGAYAGVGSCWHLTYVSRPGVAQCLPPGLWRFFRTDGSATWVLLTHGYTIWPVEVINQQFRDGWGKFCEVHKLKPEFKIMPILQQITAGLHQN